MANIQDIKATEILDSRGIPALAVTIILDDGTHATASSSTGAQSAIMSVIDMRDNDQNRFQGNGLLQAITTIEQVIKPKLIGMNCLSQQAIDKLLIELDATPNKSRLGGNTTVSISMAVAKVAAKSEHLELYAYLQQVTRRESHPVKMPIPCFTIIDGGKNANYATDFQEFLIVPASFKSFHESVELSVTLFNTVRSNLLRDNLPVLYGEKGGYAPPLATNEDALSILAKAVESLNLRLGYDIYLGIDAYANHFFKDKYYKMKDRSMPMSTAEFVSFYTDLHKKYHILYIEDPMHNDDSDGWAALYNALNQTAIIVGDTYTATSPYKLQHALQRKTMSGIVIQPAQIGTVTEALAVAEMANIAGLKRIVSDRTGETNEVFLADFAIAIGADYIKFGPPARGERVAKYNRLLEIEKLLQ